MTYQEAFREAFRRLGCAPGRFEKAEKALVRIVGVEYFQQLPAKGRTDEEVIVALMGFCK